ncbi:hypothetical protein [Burkholderia vietnamiensis]|uniref:Mom family adenine methylcarbamoylation protein n=1 Tax=Burkholderia vietnamiensis TaxID=60552 RepID=UPI001BAB72BB|nr:hypothetical protein [Burkholderia vietnamiensis]
MTWDTSVLATAPPAMHAVCQRWRDGRPSYRDINDPEPFDRRRYTVDVIDERTARTFISIHHYSKSYPAALFRIGLFGNGAELEGVAVFSVPMNQRVITAYTGVPADQGAELGRFALLDRAPRNSETYFLGQAFKVLRRERPTWKSIVSYSDPVARHDALGHVILPGHIGTIYQAHNGRYVGRSSARTLRLGPDGCVLSPRSLSKIRLGESGWEAAQRRIESLGAPKRHFGEDGATWLARVLACGMFRTLKHPGSHCYVWALGCSAARRKIETNFVQQMPYPKQPEVITS